MSGGPIINARDFPIGTGGGGELPNMSDVLPGWTQKLIVGLVTTTIERGLAKEVVRDFETQGVIQPLKPEALALKPEGERSWIWKQLHCTPSLSLKTDDMTRIKGIRYRVMAKLGYDEYGFIEYHLVQDFEGSPWGNRL